MTRVFESNGPDIKIRGTASHIAEKYLQLARDARSSGDPVAAENYYQHAEHYFRLIAAAQEQFRQNQPQHAAAARTDEIGSEDGEDDGENYLELRPGARLRAAAEAAAALHARQRPAAARTSRLISATSSNSRASIASIASTVRSRNMHRSRNRSRWSRTLAASIACPPSSPARSRRSMAAAGGYEGNGGGERFPRRRRRPHGGPRPEGVAQRPRRTGRRFQSGERVSALLRSGRQSEACSPSPQTGRAITFSARFVAVDDGTSTGFSAGISRVRSRLAGIAR